MLLLFALVALAGACKGKDKPKAPAHRFMVGLTMHFTFDDYAKSFMQAFESVLVVTAVDAHREVLQFIRDGNITGAAAQYPWMHGLGHLPVDV